MEYLDGPLLLANIVLTLIPVAGAILLGVRTRGRPLVFGLVGCLLSAAAALGFVIFQLVTSGGADVGAAVTVLLAIVARRPAAAPGPPPGYPPPGYPPGPGNYQGPWSQA